MNQVTTTGYHDVIVRAAQDPNFDVDKLERLVAMQEQQQQRVADLAFNDALAKAEAEMETIRSDANNPQARSKYASFARLDGAVRPIYTKYGFSISFNTEPSGDPNTLRAVGWLSNGMISRRYQWDNPIETKGAKGIDYTTRTWATSSAFTYSKRIILTGMFNLAVSDVDDDGIAAGGRRPPPPPKEARQPTTKPHEYADPETGEIISLEGEHLTPGMIEWLDADSWQTWLPRFMAHLRTAQTIDEVQQWWDLNTPTHRKLKDEKPTTFENLRSAVDAFKEKFA